MGDTGRKSGIDYAAFMALEEKDKPFSYDQTLTLLYALAVGMGRDPLDPRELKFVFEGEGFVAMPTLAVVVARSMLARTLPINKALLLHGEQTLSVHRPLPTAADLLADTRITRIIDKGEGKGALIYSETSARLASDDAPLFTIGMTLVARGDGGFGGPSGPTTSLHPVPDRVPDYVHVTETRADQALLYRLTGDRNPLHADPALAERAGFPVPILHGLATYGIACRAVMATTADLDPARIGAFDVRFTSPVFPGDRIETDVYVDGEIVSFRCRVPNRGVTVLNNGRCKLT